MDNAAKALTIAGGVLVGVLILSLMAYYYNFIGSRSARILNRENRGAQINEFNNNLLMIDTSSESDIPDNKGNATLIGDLITAINFAHNANMRAKDAVRGADKVVDINIRTPNGRYNMDDFFDDSSGVAVMTDEYKKFIQDTTINLQEDNPNNRAIVKIDEGSIKTTDDGRITDISYIVQYQEFAK